MNQPSLNQQLAQLEKLAELAKVTEEKIQVFNQQSQKIAQKWQDWADKKRKFINESEED